MSEPERFPGFFPLLNIIPDAWMPRLKDTELRLLLVIIRQTAGFVDPKTGARKERDWLSQSRLKQATGRAEGPLARAIASLIAQELIIAEDEAGHLLETAALRRRHLGRIYYRLGSALTPAPSTAPVESPLVSMAQAVFAGAELATTFSATPNAENKSAYAESEEASAESGMPKVHITKDNPNKRISRMHFLATDQKVHTTHKSEALKNYEPPDVPLTETQKMRIEAVKEEVREQLAMIKPLPRRPHLPAEQARNGYTII